MSRQGILCCDRVLAKTKGALVATKYFYVATEFGRPGVFCRDIMFLCCNRVGNGGEALCPDRVWPNGEVLCCDREILYRYIVGQVGKIFYHD